MKYNDVGKPYLFFKFKPLASEEDICRVHDILKKHRLYFPKYNQLNDPLEGAADHVSVAYTGHSIAEAADEDYNFVESMKERYGILSLSVNCFSPQLWAYYCNNYSGICLCYKADGSFKDAKAVSYTNQKNDYDETQCVDNMDGVIEENFYKKQEGWWCEEEWRIVKKTEDNFYQYKQNELMAIILGHRMSGEINEAILSMAPQEIKLYKTHPGMQTRSIALLPFDYKVQMDGTTPPYIRSIDGLCREIFGQEE